jgi:hypothetical protein
VPEADAQRCKQWGAAIQHIFSRKVGEASGETKDLVLQAESPMTFDHIVLQEDIREGERVREFVVEISKDGAWAEVARGSCIGHKYIHKLPRAVTTSAVRLRVSKSTAPPRIQSLALYDAP